MNAPKTPRTPATASSSSSDLLSESKDPVLNAPHDPSVTSDTPETPVSAPETLEPEARAGIDAAHAREDLLDGEIEEEAGDDGEEGEESDLPEVLGGIGAIPYEGDARCGLIAIVGRPNVGKSTLINALVGQKVSITSKKAQTTRHRITGVRTVDEAQFVFVDTPGFQTKHSTALNRNLNRTVQGVLSDVDLVLFVVEAASSAWTMRRCCRCSRRTSRSC
ncbi:50S ribosome-binding GTPase domain-containing protein [Ditylenchus destructor]|nr:50S ribosome-binding GTPase domain-containing protein [Ditylenchus destructor]